MGKIKRIPVRLEVFSSEIQAKALELCHLIAQNEPYENLSNCTTAIFHVTAEMMIKKHQNPFIVDTELADVQRDLSQFQETRPFKVTSQREVSYAV